MLKKIIDLVRGETRRNKQLVKTLDDFLANTKSNSLTDEQAKRNLEEGVIELVNYDGQHSSNGLLITDDGYFLTARHCVEGDIKQYIRFDGIQYPIEKRCANGKGGLDIALVKAEIPGNPDIRPYRFYQQTYFEASLPIAAYTRWDNRVTKKYGFTKTILSIRKDAFFSSVPVQKGDSGGVVADPFGNIMGFISSYFARISYENGLVFDEERADFHSTFSVGAKKALDLLKFYKQRVESKLL